MSHARLYPPVSSQYGAPMGRREERPDDLDRLHVQCVPMVDGCYDPGGAYWGGQSPDGRMYLAWSRAGARLWIRATSRADAIQRVREDFPEVHVY